MLFDGYASLLKLTESHKSFPGSTTSDDCLFIILSLLFCS